MKRSIGLLLAGTVLFAGLAHSHELSDLGLNEIGVYDPADYSREVTECDRLASHPDDPYRTGPGIAEEDVDLPAAIRACEAAVAADPDNPRLNYQLGRSYGYSGRGEEAMPYRRAAVEAGYPQSLFVVGYLYLNGRTIEEDVCRGAELIYKSAQAGRFAGRVAYPQYVMDGVFQGCSVPADPDEMLGFLEEASTQTDDYYRKLLVRNLKVRIAAREDLSAVRACHLAASHPDDPDRVAPGLERSEINLLDATEKCEHAYKVSPADPRVNYHLGRVLYYSGHEEDSLSYLVRAAQGGYRQAIFVLGYIRSIDGAVEPDICRSGALWETGVDLGHPWSGYHLAAKAMNGAFKECDFHVSDERITEAMCLAKTVITAGASEGRVEELYKLYRSEDREACQ